MTKEQLKQLEADLWSAADNLRANSDLKSSEYATPVLGLIFLKFADNNYRRHEADIIAEYQKLKGTRRERKLSDIAIEKCGFYLPDHARYERLLNLPEEKDIAKALKEAMKAIEEYKPELEGVLPKDEYFRLTRDEKTKNIPNQLLKTFANIPADFSGDLFGQIYEYFLAEFARSEGSKGGEFFTPRSVVRLMVEMIEPHGGKVFDPACGSGGMFVQSAQFIEEHRKELKNGGAGVFVYGQEKTLETVNLAKMNLAVNGLRGEVKKANTYYDDPHESFGAFDYVLANPPFNVDDVSLSSVEKDRRFNTYGIPRNKSKAKKAEQGKETVPNGNYLWINLFATSLKPKGRAALVMANSASDARHSEADIRRTLIEKNLIYAMLTLPSNMFYTVTLPATLWFFDKAKTDDKILFIDARNIFTQIDRAHRELSDEQLQNIALISQLHKGRREKFVQLIDRYLAEGMDRLIESKTRIEPISAELLEVLDDGSGKQSVAELVKQWAGLNKLQARYEQYREKHSNEKAVDSKNKAQHQLRETIDPFFAALHEGLKQLDKIVRQHEKQQAEQAQADGKRGSTDRKTKALKTALEALHKEVKVAEMFFQHIRWLQERFPRAEYEDVTGLCKLASPVLSATSITKPWVQKELNTAVVKNIEDQTQLIPVRLDQCEVPECLRDTLWQDIPDLENYDDAFDRIVGAVYRQYAKPPLGTAPVYVQPQIFKIDELTPIDSTIFEHACRIAIQQHHADLIDGEQVVADMKEQGISEAQVMETQEVLEGRHYIELHQVLGPQHAYAFSITTYGFEQFARVGILDYGKLCADVGRILVRQVLQGHGQASKHGVAGELNQPRMIIEHIFKVFKNSGLIKYAESIGGDLFMDVYWVSPELRRRLEGNG